MTFWLHVYKLQRSKPQNPIKWSYKIWCKKHTYNTHTPKVSQNFKHLISPWFSHLHTLPSHLLDLETVCRIPCWVLVCGDRKKAVMMSPPEDRLFFRSLSLSKLSAWDRLIFPDVPKSVTRQSTKPFSFKLRHMLWPKSHRHHSLLVCSVNEMWIP